MFILEQGQGQEQEQEQLRAAGTKRRDHEDVQGLALYTCSMPCLARARTRSYLGQDTVPTLSLFK